MSDRLTSDNMQALFHTGKHHQLGKGQLINSSDDRRLIYVAQGYIKRYIVANDGAYKVQSIYAPGYVFPLTLAFSELFDLEIYQGQETVYYEGLTDVEVYMINGDTLKAAVKSDTLLYRGLLYEAGQRFHSNIQWLENASLKSSYQRLAHMLIYLGNTFGENQEGRVRIKIPLTHQDLADILSMARETVSRHMLQLVEKRLVVAERYLIIPSIDELAAHFSSL